MSFLPCLFPSPSTPPFPLFDHPSKIRWDITNQKLLYMHTLAVFCYCRTLSFKCSVKPSVLSYLYLCFSHYRTAHALHKIPNRIIVSCVLNFYVFTIYIYIYNHTTRCFTIIYYLATSFDPEYGSSSGTRMGAETTYYKFWCFADCASQYNLSNWPNYYTNSCFIIRLFHASTCFEHMCSSSGGQNCIIRHLISQHSVGGRPVCRLRGHLHTGRPPTGLTIPDAA